MGVACTFRQGPSYVKKAQCGCALFEGAFPFPYTCIFMRKLSNDNRKIEEFPFRNCSALHILRVR
jgi:hypothetical protein